MIVLNSITTGPLGRPYSYNWPFESNHMPLSENEFDTPAIDSMASSDVVETATSETETWLKFRDETEALS